MRHPTRRAMAAIIGALVLAAAACGGDNKTSSDATTVPAQGGSPTTATGAAPAATPSSTSATAAKARIEQYLQPATSIGMSTKLTGKPPAGKKVYWLEGNIQSILPITGGFKDATGALGWNLTVLTYDPADPQGPSAA